MYRYIASFIFLTCLGVMTPLKGQAAELVYFHSEACSTCDRWNNEVGEIYSNTEEGKQLPLRPQSIHDERQADLEFVRGIVYTPTFVMVENGKELGRIVGYVTDYFFWDQVSAMIQKVDAAPK